MVTFHGPETSLLATSCHWKVSLNATGISHPRHPLGVAMIQVPKTLNPP